MKVDFLLRKLKITTYFVYEKRSFVYSKTFLLFKLSLAPVKRNTNQSFLTLLYFQICYEVLDEFKVLGIFHVRYCFEKSVSVSLSKKAKRMILGDKSRQNFKKRHSKSGPDAQRKQCLITYMNYLWRLSFFHLFL